MKSKIFAEDELDNLDKIRDSLFNDPLDPRSNTYNRKLVRPYIDWLRVIGRILLPILLSLLISIVMRKTNLRISIQIVVIVIFLSFYFMINMKKVMIGMIRIYQRYAPTSIRNKCRFEPSCSEYMILALEKYGTIKGMIKGVDRLKRCNVYNGGFDLP